MYGFDPRRRHQKEGNPNRISLFLVPGLMREFIRFAHMEDRAYISEKTKSGCGGETKVV